jgi:hypothetical protein
MPIGKDRYVAKKLGTVRLLVNMVCERPPAGRYAPAAVPLRKGDIKSSSRGILESPLWILQIYISTQSTVEIPKFEGCCISYRSQCPPSQRGTAAGA